jgi:hypothetical protein
VGEKRSRRGAKKRNRRRSGAKRTKNSLDILIA